jgi:TPR repeat protein
MMIPVSIQEKLDFLNQVGRQILNGDYTYITPLCTMLSQPKFNDLVGKDNLLETIVAELVIQSEQQLHSDNGDAFVLLGIMHHLGIGGLSNKKLAVHYYDQAIGKNNAIAMNNRALMHQQGLGGEVNNVEAIRLYEHAIALGNAEAMNRRAFMHQSGLGGEVNNVESIRLYEQAMALGNAEAMNRRAMMHQDGLGGEVNIAEAIRLYEHAIALGNAEAMCNLAFMHQRGLCGEVNLAETIKLLEKTMRCSRSITLSSTIKPFINEVRRKAIGLMNKPEFTLSLVKTLWPDLQAGCHFTDQTLKLFDDSKGKLAFYFFNTKNLGTSLSFLKHLITTISHPLHQIIGIDELEKHHEQLLKTRKTALMFFNRHKGASLKNEPGRLPYLPTELQHHILSFAQPGFIHDRSVGKIL